VSKRRCDSEIDFDFEFRPATYWPELPSEQTVLGKIQGEARRSLAERALKGDHAVQELDFVFAEALDAESRRKWGRIHPALMGGEYLPPLNKGEIEIARVSLASVTSDVIQVRARRRGSVIAFRVVDEYADEGCIYEVSPEVSEQPLSLAELIRLMDTTKPGEDRRLGDDRYDIGLSERFWNYNFYEGDGDVYDIRNFVMITSAFYPQLNAYYEQRADAWIAERVREFGCDVL
jgi:hypothetical protein